MDLPTAFVSTLCSVFVCLFAFCFAFVIFLGGRPEVPFRAPKVSLKFVTCLPHLWILA